MTHFAGNGRCRFNGYVPSKIWSISLDIIYLSLLIHLISLLDINDYEPNKTLPNFLHRESIVYAIAA